MDTVLWFMVTTVSRADDEDVNRRIRKDEAYKSTGTEDERRGWHVGSPESASTRDEKTGNAWLSDL